MFCLIRLSLPLHRPVITTRSSSLVNSSFILHPNTQQGVFSLICDLAGRKMRVDIFHFRDCWWTEVGPVRGSNGTSGPGSPLFLCMEGPTTPLCLLVRSTAGTNSCSFQAIPKTDQGSSSASIDQRCVCLKNESSSWGCRAWSKK